MTELLLSVNVDHVATLRNARGGAFPCPVEASRVAIAAGADGITVHLREDRRHIQDADVRRLRTRAPARHGLAEICQGHRKARPTTVRSHAYTKRTASVPYTCR